MPLRLLLQVPDCTLQQSDAVTQNGLDLERKKSGGRRCYSSVCGEEIYSKYIQLGFMMAGSDAKLKTLHIPDSWGFFGHIVFLSHLFCRI